MAREAIQRVVAKALHPSDMLRRTKQALHSAAAKAHRMRMARPSTDPEVKASAALQAARAFTRERPHAFWAACKAAPSLAGFVSKTDDGDAVPHDLGGLFDHIAELVRPLTAPTAPARAAGRHHTHRSDAAVERWRKHWTPLTCRRFLAVVLSVPGPDGVSPAPDTSPAGRAAALREHWQRSPRARYGCRSSTRCFGTARRHHGSNAVRASVGPRSRHAALRSLARSGQTGCRRTGSLSQGAHERDAPREGAQRCGRRLYPQGHQRGGRLEARS